MKSGRFPELDSLDIVEVRWWDSAGRGVWASNVNTPIEITSVGYFNGILDGEHGEYVSLYGHKDEEGKVSDTMAIPRSSVIAARRVSRGK